MLITLLSLIHLAWYIPHHYGAVSAPRQHKVTVLCDVFFENAQIILRQRDRSILIKKRFPICSSLFFSAAYAGKQISLKLSNLAISLFAENPHLSWGKSASTIGVYREVVFCSVLGCDNAFGNIVSPSSSSSFVITPAAGQWPFPVVLRNEEDFFSFPIIAV